MTQARDFVMVFNAYSHHNGGGMVQLTVPPAVPWHLTLCSVQTGQWVELLRSEDFGIHGVWTLPKTLLTDGTLKTGQYEISSNIESIHGFTLLVSVNGETISEPNYIVIRPPYTPVRNNFPLTYRTHLQKWEGIKTGSKAPAVPLREATKWSRPFTAANAYSEAVARRTTDYDTVLVPSVSPFGGVVATGRQRYSFPKAHGITPDSEAELVIDWVTAQYDMAPVDRRDGDVSVSSLGAVPDGYQAENRNYILLSQCGSIVEIDHATREMRTLYGWRHKADALHPIFPGLLRQGGTRRAWMEQYFEPLTGPTIARSWQMVRDHDFGNVVYVVEAQNHGVVKINLTTP
jgi:hypothetical protein